MIGGLRRTSCLHPQASVAFPQDEALKLWRHLNLLHVSAYCGLSPTYSKDNLFSQICAKHHLIEEGTRAIRELTLELTLELTRAPAETAP